MPRNFDEEREQRLGERRARWAEEERDRSFVLGGEVFEYAEMVPASVVDLIAAAAEAATDTAYFRLILDAFPLVLELGADPEATLERWQTARTKIEFRDVENAVFWVMGEISRRPTVAPSSSGERRGESGARSTETSSSEAEGSEASPLSASPRS